MELHKNRQYIACVLILAFFNSCVNHIGEEDTDDGLIPISLSSKIQYQSTRVTETTFEEKDAIGLYVLVKPETLDGERHADNIKFTYSAGNLTPESKIYYPESKEICSFISYYPYKRKAVADNKTTIDVNTKTGQADWSSFSASDFLVATASDISPGKSPVNLAFNHKLYRLNIKLKPSDIYTVEKLLALKPVVEIADVYTKAAYNFSTDKFDGYSSVSDIIPYGEWRIEDGMLVGKSANIIPQTLNKKHVLIKLEIDGTFFHTTLKEYELKSGNAEDYEITISERITAGIHPSINGWEVFRKEATADEALPSLFINTSDLSFAKSNVYKVMSGKIQVAEICKEYLSSSTVETQAIVVYPMKDNKADLGKGILLNNLKSTGKVNGGVVSWNKATNELTYSAEQLDAIERIYISPDHEIVFTQPEEALKLEAKELLLTDVRGAERISYPITKIATQYWMGSNLEAAGYTDGTKIDRVDEFYDTTAVYATSDGRNVYYSAGAAVNPLLSPVGWRISNSADWEKLDQYIKGNASVLKTGTEWNQTGVAQPTNLTGFNAEVTGLYNKSYRNNNYAMYWCVDKTEIEKAIGLTGANNNNKINNSSTANPALGLSIRCIME